jgi:predicted DNA-binding transcriptional regulator AlpA
VLLFSIEFKGAIMSAIRSRVAATVHLTHENNRSAVESDGCLARQNQRAKPDPVFRDQLLSDKEVAFRYKVEKQTIWRWVRTSKDFPKPFKVEGTTRWSENELDEHDRKLKEAR